MRSIFIIFVLMIWCREQMPAGTLFQHQSVHDAVLSAATRILSQQQVHSAFSDSYGTKCGLPLALDIKTHWNEFSARERQLLSQLTTAPSRQKNRIVGNFRIWYDTTGFNAPGLLDTQGNRIPNSVEQYIDSVGTYFMFAWNFETGTLGYDYPPFETGQLYYNVYVTEFGTQLYGQTVPVDPIGNSSPQRYTTYIEIDNDYAGFYSSGISGLEVTSAHEFHHAIQLGSYGFWDTDRFFLEITSTWMETVVHGDVHDYYQYLTNNPAFFPSQFSTPEIRFTELDGIIEYSRAIWGKFIEKRFTRDIMRHAWEYIRQVPALVALDHALNDAGSSLRQALDEWAIWNSRTGPQADTIRYYTEGFHYPPMHLNAVIQYSPPERVISDSMQVLGSKYYPVLVNGVQMIVIISNLLEAYTPDIWKSFIFTMSNQGDNSAKLLTNGIYVKLSVSDPENWADQESVPSVVADVLVYPNPYILKRSTLVNFRLPPVTQSTARLSIFSTSMLKIVSKELDVMEPHPQEPQISWDGHNERGDASPSGVYLFVIEIDNKQYTGKFALIRE